MYFNMIEFLLQKIDFKLELAHVVLVAEFIRRVGKLFKRNLIRQHEIFKNEEIDDPFFEGGASGQISTRWQTTTTA